MGSQKRLVLVSVLAGTLVILIVLFLLQALGKLKILASVTSDKPLYSLTLTNQKSEVTGGTSVTYFLTIANASSQTKTITVGIKGTNLEFTPGENEQKLDSASALRLFAEAGAQGLLLVERLNGGQSKTHNLSAKVSSTATGKAEVLAKAEVLTLNSQNQETQTVVAEASDSDAIVSNPKISLLPGYNFITLPYELTTDQAETFLKSLPAQWAYRFDPEKKNWVSLFEPANYPLVVPGAGFWVYDNETQNKDISLPQGVVSPDSDRTVTIRVKKGYNQLGNPFLKPMKITQDISVYKTLNASTNISENLLGNLEEAVNAKLLTLPYIAGVNPSTNQSEAKQVELGGTITPLAGFWLISGGEYDITFPGEKLTK